MKSTKRVVVLVALGVWALTISGCGTGDLSAPAPTSAPSPGAPSTAASSQTPTLAPTGTPTVTPSPTMTRTPTATFTPTATPRDMLRTAFYSALSKLKTYRAKIQDEGQTVEVVLPDRLAEWGAQPIGQVGRTVYIYDSFSGGVRTLDMGGLETPLDRANLVLLAGEFYRSPQIVLLGPATVENAPCIGYSATFALTKINAPATPGVTPVTSALSQPVKIWFAVSDGFPRRFERGAPTPSVVTFYDFNAPIDPFVAP